MFLDVRISGADCFINDVRVPTGITCVAYSGFVATYNSTSGRTLSASNPQDRHLFEVAFAERGPSFPEFADGQFAAVLVTTPNTNVYIICDVLGLHPVFYTKVAGRFIISTDLLQLNSLVQNKNASIDRRYFAEFLLSGDHFGDRTPYVSIKRVAQGSFVELQGRDILPRRLDWGALNRELHYQHEEEYDQQFLELLSGAVGAYCDSHNKTLIELSGGLDSTTVYSVASRLSPRKVSSFSIRFSGSKSADEGPWIAEAKKKYPNMEYVLDMDQYPHYSRLPGRPFGEPSGAMLVPSWDRDYEALCREADVQVVLTGDGGDAVLGGDEPRPHFLADHLLGLRLQEAWNQAGLIGQQLRGDRSRTHVLFHHGVLPLIRHLRGHTQTGLPFKAKWMSESFVRSMNALELSRRQPFTGVRGVSKQAHVQLIRASARAGARFYRGLSDSWRFRHPLLARSLVEFMVQVPWNQRGFGRYDRVLQRRAMNGIVPEPIRRRTTKAAVDHSRVRGLADNSDWYSMISDPKALVIQMGFVERNAWLDAVERARLGDLRNVRLFDAVCLSECWLQQELGA